MVVEKYDEAKLVVENYDEVSLVVPVVARKLNEKFKVLSSENVGHAYQSNLKSMNKIYLMALMISSLAYPIK